MPKRIRSSPARTSLHASARQQSTKTRSLNSHCEKRSHGWLVRRSSAEIGMLARQSMHNNESTMTG
jgi:hypothetical protein